MQRVMIIGQPGSGKSTLARAMGDITGLPVVHVDKIHWKSGWIERDDAEKDQLCLAAHMQDRWIFEGGRSKTWAERLDRADTFIWLDFPLGVRYWRVYQRYRKFRGKTRPDLPEDCPERLNWEFIKWIWDTRETSRDGMHRWYNAVPSHKTKHRFRSSAQVAEYLKSLQP